MNAKMLMMVIGLCAIPAQVFADPSSSNESYSHIDQNKIKDVPGGPSDDHQRWPFNGAVSNQSDYYYVNCWSDDMGDFRVPPGSTTPTDMDVDFCQAPKTGQWYKLKWHTFTVDKNGNVSGYACTTPDKNMDCR
jgi:hypothetical protein